MKIRLFVAALCVCLYNTPTRLVAQPTDDTIVPSWRSTPDDPEQPTKTKKKKTKRPDEIWDGVPLVPAEKRPCSFGENTVDKFTGNIVRQLQPEIFFTYTNADYKKYMRGKEYLTCEAYVAAIGATRTLNLRFILDSPYGNADYGGIDRSTLLLIRLINGETVSLISQEASQGDINKIKGTTTFSTYFLLDTSHEKLLKRYEIDEVRMIWNKGYEDYQVYNVDFLRNQLRCINN